MSGIKKYRERAGLTQTSLADALGVTQAAVAMWESGARKPNVSMIVRIAKALKCTTDELLFCSEVEESQDMPA